jgi:UDP-N-acetylmuramate--alanine ligase
MKICAKLTGCMLRICILRKDAMNQRNILTYRSKIKAAHRYDVVESLDRLDVSGRRFHFIGAGGIGMSGLAQILMRNRAVVTGSDQTESSVAVALRQLGADIKIGHSHDNLSTEADAVVISAAIKDDNPELQLARKKNLKVFKYAQMLGQLMNYYNGIAISGTHGKSTTSGWLSFLLKQAGIDVNFIVGAEVTQLGGSCGTGESRYFIAEACEYDRSFLSLNPKIACILNIEQDHLDYYKDEQEIVDAFSQFALRVSPDGVIIINGQDDNVTRAIANCRLRGYDWLAPCETFGFSRRCNFHARNIRLSNGIYAFDVYYNDRCLGSTRISVPGRHNILNALAVIALAVNVGVPAQRVLQLLEAFTGINRRLMQKGRFMVSDASYGMQAEENIHTQYAANNSTITVLDDYAHHPTEIKASLAAIRERYQPRRIWCVFQPHQYSRTRFLLDDFAESFKLADVTIVPEIYFVRDSQLSKKQVNSQMLVDKVRANGSEALFINSFEAICDYLLNNVTAGDLVVTMGAGDVWKVADEYIQRLRSDS